MMDDAEMAALIDAREMDRFEAGRAGRVAAPPAHPVACADCGVQIPPERLRIVPATRRCVRCQSWLEH